MSATPNLSLDRLGLFLKRGSTRARLLLIPIAVFETVFFLLPLLYLFRLSLYRSGNSAAFVPGTLSFESYATILTSSFVHQILFFTVKMAVISTVITIAIAFVYSYAIWQSSGLKRTALLFSIVLPLLTTLVAKLYAWLVLLSPKGTTNALLLDVGMIGQPLPLMYNFFGVIVGQVYIILPYAVLAIYSVMSTLDWETVEAARDLGASRPRSVLEVVLPGSMPGIIVGTIVTWAWGIGAYASPSLLGSGSERTLSIEVESRMLTEFNWPEASAMSLLMLVLVLSTVIILFNVMNRFEGEQNA
ncbi:ABC transporter permease [Halobellus marinus]|uniref:ABC transporter permease n=1 Tax=Halobellus TaxID=1073986 RepID=UPI0028AAA211|nr:ABC transporter permease [Halobellus sp. DFY28]